MQELEARKRVLQPPAKQRWIRCLVQGVYPKSSKATVGGEGLKKTGNY